MTLRVVGVCRACRQMSDLLLLDDHRCPQCRATGRQEERLRPVPVFIMQIRVGVGLILLMLLVLWMLLVIL